MDPRETIQLYADNIQVGHIESHRCPYCQAPEKCFSIGRVSIDHYWWKCWRNSCGEQGATAKFIFAPQYTYQAQTFIPRPIPEARVMSTVHDATWINRFRDAGYTLKPALAGQIGLYADADVVYRVYWRCVSLDGTFLGWQERTDHNGTKTVRTWRETPGPFYYQARRSRNPWVLVEDPFSAAVVALDGGNSLALLGTQITSALALELPASEEYIVALDAGAEDAALAALAQLRGLGLRARWLPLRRDLKNMDREARQNLLACYGALPHGS